MTHNQAIGNLITAVLTDYTVKDARTLDLDELLDQEALKLSGPIAVVSQDYRAADPESILENGRVLSYSRRANAWLVGVGRDVSADADRLISSTGLNGNDAEKRAYTIDGELFTIAITEVVPQEAEHGFGVIQMTIDIQEHGE